MPGAPSSVLAPSITVTTLRCFSGFKAFAPFKSLHFPAGHLWQSSNEVPPAAMPLIRNGTLQKNKSIVAQGKPTRSSLLGPMLLLNLPGSDFPSFSQWWDSGRYFSHQACCSSPPPRRTAVAVVWMDVSSARAVPRRRKLRLRRKGRFNSPSAPRFSSDTGFTCREVSLLLC